MRIHFHGASRGVTGSCFLLESGSSRVLVDCGMFQGPKTEKDLNYREFPFRPQVIDAVLLTHAHIDHSGLIPKLCNAGFQGPIFATPATIDLCSIMLPDSGNIQEFEVEQLNRRNARGGKGQLQPIYTREDAEACLAQFRPIPFATWSWVAEGVRARFWNAGHLLGSASIEVEITSVKDETLRLLFSGDIGPKAKLLQFDPIGPNDLDYVVCESTYGDRVRALVSDKERSEMLAIELRDAEQRDGALLIPSFAVERTQELLVDIIGLMERGAVTSAPIFIDSPLATHASDVFAKHARELQNGDSLMGALRAPNVRFTESVDESKALARIRGFHVIISASGMCEAGRIRHHLKNWIWRREGTVLFVGYQAQGTLGRILLDGAKRVRIMGEEFQVRSQIRSLDYYSGHADAAELQSWLHQRQPINGCVFFVHGEEPAIDALTARIAADIAPTSIIAPRLDDVFDLTRVAAKCVTCDADVRLRADKVAQLDWHNDLSKLILDINDVVRDIADENGRQRVLRRLRRALAETQSN
jgi:metallo-beta-lactamase family protein